MNEGWTGNSEVRCLLCAQDTRVPEVGGGEGGGRPPCPLTGRARGAEGAPPIRKCNIINIHISLNLRRIQKDNDNFFILGARVHQIFDVLIVLILTKKKNCRIWQNVSFARLPSWMPLSRDSPPLP